MRSIFLLCCLIYLAHGQGNGNGNGNGNGAGNGNGNGNGAGNGIGNGNGDDEVLPLPITIISTLTSSTSTIPPPPTSASSTSTSLSSSSEPTSVSTPTTTTSQTESSKTSSSITSTFSSFTQPPISTPTSQPTSSRPGSGSTSTNTGLIIAGSVIGAIVLLGIMVFIYRKIRGLDDEDFKIERQDPRPFVHDRLSAPDYGRNSEYVTRPQYAVYPTVGRPGLPGFVEKGQIVETPEQMDTNYYGTPEFVYQPEYYNHYHAERSNQYSNPQLGYPVARPQDSMKGARQY